MSSRVALALAAVVALLSTSPAAWPQATPSVGDVFRQNSLAPGHAYAITALRGGRVLELTGRAR